MKTFLALLLTSFIVLALYAFWIEPSRLIVNHYDIAINSMPEIKIAVIADLHAGAPYIDEDKIAKIVEETNAQKPDLILLPGDFIVQEVLGAQPIAFSRVTAILKNLQAPMGVFAVMGNHDWWGRDIPGMQKLFEDNGIHVLEDRSVKLKFNQQNIGLAGISDYYEGPHDVVRALQDVPPGQGVLCLTHTPDIFPELPAQCHLTITGHTHGGQVNLPFVGALIVPSKYGQRYVSGLVTELGKSLFVSTGIGTSILPVRFGVTPEISILHVMPAEHEAPL